MKLMIINTPNREQPTTFPPYAALSLVNYLKKNGFNDDEVDFYNVDYHRPSINSLFESIKKNKPKVLGISALVSTSYKFTKQISLLVKKHLPDTVIIIGGNLAASAEILLRKTGVDFCVLSEGEKVLLSFMQNIEKVGLDFDKYKDIKGLVFIDSSGELVNTGYSSNLDKEELYDIDWGDLRETEPYYIYSMFDEQNKLKNSLFETDERVFEKHRKNKKMVTFIVGKGCVAKCTFCHRWDKGIRHIPVKVLMQRLDYLIERYDVGFIVPQIEAFGCDENWLFELCDELKSRDILWYAGSVRAKTISKKLIDKMYDSGCTSIVYGLETGSEKMLEVMEKKTTLEENINALELTIEKGYYSTVLQFVIGMPGESPKTIKESADFAAYCMTLSKWTNPRNMAINYAQALPGTPLYEFARKKGLISTNIDGEEQYLIEVSDKNAADPISVINFTEYPMIEYWSWGTKLYLQTIYTYIKTYGKEQYILVSKNSEMDVPLIDLVNNVKVEKIEIPSLFRLLLSFKIRQLPVYYPELLYHFRSFLPIIILFSKVRQLGLSRTLTYLLEYIKYLIKLGRVSSKDAVPPKSLRITVNNDLLPIETDPEAMIPLRKGR